MFTSCSARWWIRLWPRARWLEPTCPQAEWCGGARARRLQTSIAKGVIAAEPKQTMQTVIQVITTGSGSLRNKIMSDSQLDKKFGFIKVWAKQPGRPHGWAKIHSAHDAHGAINLEWHARSGTLICRVVTKFGNKPNTIIGDFIDYLLARHQSRILAIHIMRRSVREN